MHSARQEAPGDAGEAVARSRRAVGRARTSGGTRFLGCLLGLLGVALVAFGGRAVRAAEDTALRDALLSATTFGELQAAMGAIEGQERSWIERVIGEVFRDRETFQDKRDAIAFAAAWFVDHPVTDAEGSSTVILVSDIVKRAFEDPEFVQRLRDNINPRTGGWQRLLDEAWRLLESDDLLTRAAGVWFLSLEDGEQFARVVWGIRDRAKADVAILRRSNGAGERLARTYLEAFKRLLGYPFPTVERALAFLEGKENLLPHQLVREATRLMNAENSPRNQRMLEMGKRLVQFYVAAKDLASLTDFVDPRKYDIVELRLFALDQVLTLGPKPTDEWRALLCTSLAQESDPKVLARTLDALERMDFGEAEKAAQEIGGCVVERFRSRRDGKDERVKLARVLGQLGILQLVVDAADAVGDGGLAEVRAELVRSMGRVRDASAAVVLDRFRANPGADEAAVKLRVAAVDALGAPGMVASDGVVAADALRKLLSGSGQPDIPQAAEPTVRVHAIGSLAAYPGLQTAAVLGAIALAQDDRQANEAVLRLGGGLLVGEADARQAASDALVAVVRQASVPVERRTRALRELASHDGEAGPDVRAAIAKVAREILGSKEEPPELRREAATALAALGDVASLDQMLAFWGEETSPERDAAMRAWIFAVADQGKVHDLLVSKALLGIGAAGRWDWAEELAGALAESYPRVIFQVTLAQLFHAHAGVEDRPVEDRRSDLEAANTRLEALLTQGAQDMQEAAIALRGLVLRDLGDLENADDAAALARRKAYYLQALAIGTQGTTPNAVSGLVRVLASLEEAPLGPLLTPDEQQTVAAAKVKIQSLMGG